jgi:hypothetical protein
MEPFRPEGVNLPNVMTPGAWALVIAIIAAILCGFGFMLFKMLKDRIQWKPLAGFYAAKYFAEENQSFNTLRLVLALRKAEELFKLHTKWTQGQLSLAFQRMEIYVKKDDTWVCGNQKIAGLDPSGRVIIVGANLAALLHEMAHQVEEKVDKIVDSDHVGWVSRGIRAADDAFQEWLKT